MSRLDVAFGREFLKNVMEDINTVTTIAERKEAWVYKLDNRGHWEFHGPSDFYWHGEAETAYDARAKGWSAWWTQLEEDADAMRARVLGQQNRVASLKGIVDEAAARVSARRKGRKSSADKGANQ
jgi:hypothetical protein